MLRFKATIKRFGAQGEKTGWSYIDVPAALAKKLNPDSKKGFRIKGKIDHYSFNMVSLVPMGGGDFIMALKAEIRKAIKKQKGAEVEVVMEVDHNELQPPKELLECLADEPEALAYFQGLIKSHQNYFTNYINSAKTEPTRAKRIAHTINALCNKWNYAQMIRAQKI